MVYEDKNNKRRFGHVSFSDNSGLSVDDAIKITGAQSSFDGVGAEYEYIQMRFGEKGRDWTLKLQALVEDGEKVFDRLDLVLIKEKKEISLFFDISDFFGRF